MMKRRCAIPLCCLLGIWLALATLLAGSVPARAQSSDAGLRVQANEAEARFAESIFFHLQATSETSITDVMLMYRLGGSAITGRAYADFQPGSKIDAEWTWELEPGDLPPGTTITYYWRLYDDAGKELRTPPQTVAYPDDRFDWLMASQNNVNVYTYQGDEGEALLQDALKALERLQSEIGVTLEQPIHIYVYADRSDMRLALPSRSDRYDEMTITLGMVVSEDTLLLRGDDDGVKSTLAHELSHIVVGMATENPLAGLPRWLDEGLAMYAEGDLPSNNRSALDNAIQENQLISVRSLSGYSGDPELVDLFYAEAHSLVSFLLDEYGREKMTALLATFRRGAYQDDALQEIYGFGMDGLDQLWREYLGLGSRPTPAVTPASQQLDTDEPDLPVCTGAFLPGLGLGLLGLLLKGRHIGA